jgi:hypothetical protein
MHSSPRPTSHHRLRRCISALVFVAGISAGASGCSEDALDLAKEAEAVFSDDTVWRGDHRYVTVTITETSFLSVIDLEMYLAKLGFSPAVYERMNRTRALDGTQSATADGVNVTWTYHPDNGLQAVFEREVER